MSVSSLYKQSFGSPKDSILVVDVVVGKLTFCHDRSKFFYHVSP